MSLTTNDPSAPYGEKREPMVKDEDLDAHYDKYDDGPRQAAQNMRDWYEGFIDHGDLIRREELVTWLDAEIAMTAENLQVIKDHSGGLKPLFQFEAILATYKAVKAHIEG
jgi:hypothetical protein